jgi:hypothetical protein
VSRPHWLLAIVTLLLVGCAAVLGITDVPPADPDALGDGGRDSVRPSARDADAAQDGGADADKSCRYSAPRTLPVLCFASDNERCRGATEQCCDHLGALSCTAPCPGSDDLAWECETKESCPSSENRACCAYELRFAGGECPLRAQPYRDGGSLEGASFCRATPCYENEVTLCRSDAECSNGGTCQRMRIDATNIKGEVGACAPAR